MKTKKTTKRGLDGLTTAEVLQVEEAVAFWYACLEYSNRNIGARCTCRKVLEALPEHCHDAARDLYYTIVDTEVES